MTSWERYMLTFIFVTALGKFIADVLEVAPKLIGVLL